MISVQRNLPSGSSFFFFKCKKYCIHKFYIEKNIQYNMELKKKTAQTRKQYNPHTNSHSLSLSLTQWYFWKTMKLRKERGVHKKTDFIWYRYKDSNFQMTLFHSKWLKIALGAVNLILQTFHSDYCISCV